MGETSSMAPIVLVVSHGFHQIFIRHFCSLCPLHPPVLSWGPECHPRWVSGEPAMASWGTEALPHPWEAPSFFLPPVSPQLYYLFTVLPQGNAAPGS